ncbi:DMT family transporter [Nodosilinea sp. LEGE 07298]|uniref:DMT family transporter n=1 Tax=Nodosilinea sp. LEGE 07298 TaxID=2777970 RepID=UPI0018824707|nr:DMT family transporter [Nodosilinea sp. LEGE 07298]MBE9109871.1 DMT family transporter [Nodosilinea sp. LEGE 07298]
MNKIIIALSYAFCWGVGVTLTKIALSEITATTLLIIQLLSSVLFLATVCYLKERQFPFSWQRLKQGFAGIFEPALAYMFGIFGVKMTTVSNATLIASTEVILTIIFAAAFLGEKLTRAKFLLAGISFLGVSLLVLQDAQGAIHSSLIGDSLVLLGTLFAVVYVLFSKKQIETTNPLQLTTSQQTVGLITTVLCFSMLSILNPSYDVNAANISPQFWLLAVSSGIMQYALAFLLYLVALQNLPVSHAAFYLSLIPIFGVASAVVIIGEQPNLAQWVGGGLVVVSSSYANRLKPTQA